MTPIEYASTLNEGRLLMFYGFGIAILTLTIQIKLKMPVDENYQPARSSARYASIYHFVKVFFNWGVFYFICSCLLLLSSCYPESNTIEKPLLYNLSFYTCLVITIYFTLCYLRLVIFSLFWTWVTAMKAGL